jgi:AcrR family transcriptional regulator
MSAVGRPRRFDAADEVRLIFDAAFAVMERNGYQDVAVADILAEAGISTRSFYRHFGSKDELLRAMYRREAEAATARLEARVAEAGSPRAGLEAWIDEVLSYGSHRVKARRAAVLGSAGTMRAEGYADEMAHAAQLLVAPLVAVLDEGRADGSFPDADPEADADMIQAIVWRASGLSPFREAPGNLPGGRRAVLSFALRALGARG